MQTVEELGALIAAKIVHGYEGLGGYNPKLKLYFPYQGGADRKGVWTIGRGHVIKPAEHKSGRFKNGLTLAQVDALFVEDWAPRIAAVKKLLKGKYTAQQFAGALSLYYNCGEALEYGHSFGDAHRAGNTKQAAKDFLLYINSNGRKQLGLWRRRMTEALCYLTGEIVIAKDDASSAVLKNKLRKQIAFITPQI